MNIDCVEIGFITFCIRIGPRMTSSVGYRIDKMYRYKYKDLEGNVYGPFEGIDMAKWDARNLFDDDLIIYRISKSDKVFKSKLGDLKKKSANVFLQEERYEETDELEVSEKESESEDVPVESTKKSNEGEGVNNEGEVSDAVSSEASKSLECLSSSDSGCFNPHSYPSPPFMRLPDPGSILIKPEDASAKVFGLYQLIITVPRALLHFPPYQNEKVCCLFCKTVLTGSQMFGHIINIKHMSKVSGCVFSASDIDYWMERVQNVIKSAPSEHTTVPGFSPELHLNTVESVSDFINRTKGFTKRLSMPRLRKASQMQFIQIAVDKTAATQYATCKSNRSKRKLTGDFLSQVIETQMRSVDRANFQRQYGKLLEDHSKCSFCDTEFNSFYELCLHIGSREHRQNINFLPMTEGHVATWVRLLAHSDKRRADGGEEKTAGEGPAAKMLCIDID